MVRAQPRLLSVVLITRLSSHSAPSHLEPGRLDSGPENRLLHPHGHPGICRIDSALGTMAELEVTGCLGEAPLCPLGRVYSISSRASRLFIQPSAQHLI